MNDARITIFGASGTGKTTLGQALAQRLGFPHFDSDQYYHYLTDPPFTRQRSPQERTDMLAADLKPHPSWVLSGGAALWEPPLPLRFSLIVFLYLPPDLRRERILERETRLYGARLQAGGDMEFIHRDFMKWSAGYDDGTAEGTCTLPRHLAFLQVTSCPVVRIEQAMTLGEQVEQIVAKF